MNSKKYVKAQRNGLSNLQSANMFLSLGVPREDWNKLKAGEVVELPIEVFESNIIVGIDMIGNPFIRKEEPVDTEEEISDTTELVTKKQRKKKTDNN